MRTIAAWFVAGILAGCMGPIGLVVLCVLLARLGKRPRQQRQTPPTPPRCQAIVSAYGVTCWPE